MGALLLFHLSGCRFLEGARCLPGSIYFLGKTLEEFWTQFLSLPLGASHGTQLLMFPRKTREEGYCMPVFQRGTIWMGG